MTGRGDQNPANTHTRTHTGLNKLVCSLSDALFSRNQKRSQCLHWRLQWLTEWKRCFNIVCFYNSENLLVSGNLKIQRSVFCALLYSHHYRQDGAVILQIDHSYCYWGDVLQLLGKRLAGAGQHWRKSCEQRNKGSKKETFNVILQMIQNTWCHTGRFSKWGRRRLTGELECLMFIKSTSSWKPSCHLVLTQRVQLRLMAWETVRHDVKPASSTIKAERKHSCAFEFKGDDVKMDVMINLSETKWSVSYVTGFLH